MNTTTEALMNLQTATPREIDEKIAAIYTRYYKALDIAERHDDTVRHLQSSDFRGQRYGTDAEIAEAEFAAEAAHNAAREILTETVPYNDQYLERGWTRAYLVDNTNGHVHRSMHCSTCFPTTRYVWLTEFSGKTEAEIVDAAGERACTVCYPTAPAETLARPTRIFSPSELEAQAARDAKAAENAAKAKLEISVMKPNGRVHTYKTERGATNAIAQALSSHLMYAGSVAELHAANSWVNDASIAATVAAVAAKRGVEAEVVWNECKAKAEKRADQWYRAQTLPTWAEVTA